MVRDIDPAAVSRAKLNAEHACVTAGRALQMIGSDAKIMRPEFIVSDFADLSAPYETGMIITNPPYGERIGDVSQAEEMGIAPVVYYSSTDDLDIESHHDLDEVVDGTEPKIMYRIEAKDELGYSYVYNYKMLGEDGTPAPESRRAIPTPWVSALKMLGFDRRYYMSHLPWDQPCRIEVVSGAFCLLRREALDQIGLLDEDFFMYGEDIDLSYRLLKGGWENWYLPLPITHYKGKSTRKSEFRYVHVFYQAMLIFFRKHYSHLSIFYTLPVKAAIYFRALIALIDLLRQKLHL